MRFSVISKLEIDCLLSKENKLYGEQGVLVRRRMLSAVQHNYLSMKALFPPPAAAQCLKIKFSLLTNWQWLASRAVPPTLPLSSSPCSYPLQRVE